MVAIGFLIVSLSVCFFSLGFTQHETTPRQRAPVAAFRKLHPCPGTNNTSGACPGWVVDHKYPLCAGGKDDPSNMQWQRHGESLTKDKVELELCRCLKEEKK